MNNTYEKFAISIYENNTFLGYVANQPNATKLEIADYNDQGILCDSYSEALGVIRELDIMHSPRYNFSVEVVYFDDEDMRALCY